MFILGLFNIEPNLFVPAFLAFYQHLLTVKDSAHITWYVYFLQRYVLFGSWTPKCKYVSLCIK